MPEYLTLLVTRSAGILTITFNRPKVNAMNEAMARETISALEEASRDEELRVVVLTGSGRAFCAGQEMSEMQEAAGKISYREHMERTYNPLVLRLQSLPKPVLAGINGPVAGAGLGIALSCDLRLASESAVLRYGFSRLGLGPDSGVSYWLPRLVGYGQALDLVLMDEPISAQRALQMGLVSRIVPDRDFASELASLAQKLASGPTQAFALAKHALQFAQSAPLSETLGNESQVQEVASRTQDHLEGVRAFVQKRQPVFRGN
ncbi:MAG: enoyl-CoA hydratase [Anaerolineales bacterium]|jgi:2-(1,2-epoxy-1,2-dihydrophenyl)acetyl-CoA isomerase